MTAPNPCITGGAGSSAVFSNGGTTIFTYPPSATHIQNTCYTWQSASMYIWFDMAPEDQDAFIDSLRWDVRPLTTTQEPPTFGSPRSGIEYVFGEYNKYREGVSFWIDTSETPNHVYVFAWLD